MKMEILGRIYCLLLCVSCIQEGTTGRLPEVTITEAKSVTPKKIILIWKPTFTPKRVQPEYIIRYKPKGGHSTRTFSKKEEITLKSLQPDTTYVIAVRAVNGKSRSDWSNVVEIKTKAKSGISNDDITTNITVEEVNENSVELKWTLNSLDEDLKDFEDFQVILKCKDKQQKRKTKESNIHLTGLTPDTSYAANLYIILTSGKKIRVGRAKFQTLEEQRTAPRKLKVKSATHKSIAVKWKHIKSQTSNVTVTGYTIQYKRRGVTNSEACTIDLDPSQKSYRIQGLLPDEKYSIRVSGQFNNIAGPFTEWLRVKTLEYSPDIENIYVYHTSPTSVLLLWKPFPWISNISHVLVQVLTMDEASTYEEQNIAEDKRAFEVEGDKSYIQIYDLLPQTKYQATLTFFGQDRCKYHKAQEFTTVEAKCVEECNIQTTNETYTSESYLRIIPLPNDISLVTWQPFTHVYDVEKLIYVIRVLGEPFLHHLSTHLIPDGQRYKVLHGMAKDKTYTINLQVFDANHGGQPLASQYLLVMPTKDLIRDKDDVVTDAFEAEFPWQPTSLDMLTNRFEDVFLKENLTESYAIQDIQEANITLISKVYIEEDWDIVNVTSTTEEAPMVYAVDDVSIMEDMAFDITCFARGDPYPITSLLNISSNQTLGEEETNMTQTVSVAEAKYVGSTSLVDGRAFMGIRRFITMKNLSYWNTGQYACAAENFAGSDSTVFQITVIPKPPKNVKDLYVKPLTPFEIEVGWRPPDNRTVGDHGRVIGYHVIVADEYNVVLWEKNSSVTTVIFQDLLPDTLYAIRVSAYHNYSEGQETQVHVRTPKIPTLGPPQNISMKTLNSTTIQVSWLPPREVIERKIHLRAFLFHHREVGSQGIEEMQLKKMFTNVSIIDLIPDRKYEVQVLAMSEDAQISQTGWVEGNTSRESYMNESAIPPPPSNVFLNLQGGNIIVSWLPPKPDENILVRGYTIDVFYNNTKLQTMEVGYKESSVILYDVEMGVLYRISVKARNRVGTSIDHWEELKVPIEHVTDEPVQNFKGRALSSTQLELTWDPPGSGKFSRFVLSYTLAGDLKPELPGGGNLPETSKNYIVRSLQPYTGYVFFITPYLKDMRGETANTTVTTFTDKPAFPPTNISLTVLNATTILIKCVPPEEGKNGPIIQYRVAYRDSNFRNNILTDAEDDEDLYFHLNGLVPDTVYEIRVRALTVNGSGPWSQWLQERTKKRVPVLPKVPQNLTTTVSGTSITLVWSPPDQHFSELTGYVVGFGRFIPEVYRTSVTKDKNSYKFSGLDPESVYIVSVRSFNEFGESAAVFDLVTTE